MRFLLTFVSLFMVVTCAFGQGQNEKLTISGRLIDGDTNEPMDMATVQLFWVNDTIFVGGTISNSIYNYIKLTPSSASIKKTSKSQTFTVKLTKGKTLLKNKKVTFTFNGKTYTAKTNSKGIAKVVIPSSVIKKLKAGSKYTLIISYLKKSIKRIVTVK